MERFLIRTTSKASTSKSAVENDEEKRKNTGCYIETTSEIIETTESTETEANETDSEISENSEVTECELGPKRSKKAYYKHKFNDSFKTRFSCAEKHSETETLCKVCNIKITGSVSHLKRHDLSNSHKENFNIAKCTPTIEHLFKKPTVKSTEEHVKESELKMVMFLAEHNLPFSLMEHLPQLISSVCPDSKIAQKLKQHIKRKKATQLATTVLGPFIKEDLIRDLRENYFSIIIDETTDISTSKCLTIIVRYFKNNSVIDRFFDLCEVQGSAAQDLFNVIKCCFERFNIPIKNCIGFGADNCSVMMGNIGGVKALFEKVNPHIKTIGCTCHSFHLCASYACKKLPKSIEQFSRDIYNYFSNSAKRCIELRECEIFTNEKPHVMLRPSQTRWLSLELVVNRILEHWSSLELFFTRAALEDNVQSAQSILNALKNPIYKVYFQFLSYILDIINKMNLEFQSEAPKIHLLLGRVRSLYKLILKSFIQKDVIDSNSDLNSVIVSNPHNYLPLEQIYCGAKVGILLKNGNIDQNDVKNFKIRVLDFFIELTKQIKQRFNFSDSLLIFASNFDPKVVISGNVNSISDTELLFPYLQLDLEKLDLEYRLLCETDECKKFNDCDIIEFWNNVSQLKNTLNEQMFPNVVKVAKVIISLPHSSAAAERIFSQLNLIKVKTRNRLLVKTCASLLLCKDVLRVEKKKCFEWTPSAKMTTFSKTYVENHEVLDEDVVLHN